MSDKIYNSYLTIDLKKLVHNVKNIQKSITNNVECIAVLKSDAYNLGALKIGKTLYDYADIRTFAVAQVYEGIDLRKSGLVDCNIIILSGVSHDLLEYAVEYDLQISVFNQETVLKLQEIAKKQGKIAKVQLKIETGLHRIGVLVENGLIELLNFIKSCENIEIFGVFSHFANGEIENHPSCIAQYEIFKKALQILDEQNVKPPQIHICNSGGSDWFFDAYCTAVRIGRRLYMDSQTCIHEKDSIGFTEEICTWSTKITNISNVSCGEAIGYGEKNRVKRNSKIAIICVGYADGICPEYVKQHIPVLIGDKKVPILATCMDQSFIDVTDISCEIGDEVTIFGKNEQGFELSAQELGNHVDAEGVALFSTISNRVCRIYNGEF